MARLERKRGGDIVAATYGMRVMRWLGNDTFGDLDFTVRSLRANGFTSEASVTEAMLSDPAKADERIGAYLQRQFQAQKAKAPGPFAIEDDRRSSPSPRVSVIVSLYNAESKLKLFLDQLSGQSLLEAGQMEIILIDSGSPTNERQAFEALMAEHPLPVLYARTAERETIQAAWNRGIKLARAPYLSFLGVDEGVHPDGYTILAKMLDDQPGIDWVMADSVVTEVDRKGGFVTDVMTYDRHGYTQSLVYLETCYLSWVGGLYRRSIHERFGYYDETFRGAGDTEFKSRILPHIKSGHIAEPLGLFLNYPEERTTQHPRAEIEDQRAWYLFRTTAGAAYVWDGKPIEAVEDFFRQCLRYRKSFCGHVSTDLDMAHALARYMVQRGENPEFASAALRSSSLLIQLIRSIEVFDFRLSPSERSEIVLMALVSAKRQEFIDAESFKMSDAPRYEIFNDNRFEQHWYSWSS
jgi:glycosyltransferase involved in cell wall biosynthesis